MRQALPNPLLKERGFFAAILPVPLGKGMGKRLLTLP